MNIFNKTGVENIKVPVNNFGFKFESNLICYSIIVPISYKRKYTTNQM